MTNTYTMTTANIVRTFTAEQFIEVMRDLFHVNSFFAKANMDSMEEGVVFYAKSDKGVIHYIVKNKAEA